MPDPVWLDEPEDHDYPAALEYLSLIWEDKYAQARVKDLKQAEMTTRKAKDILRASGLPLLPKDDEHVAKAIKKIEKGTPLSPILLVRSSQGRVLIADGYHRVCASYHLEDDTEIPCKLV